jgi:hypothetical protein
LEVEVGRGGQGGWIGKYTIARWSMHVSVGRLYDERERKQASCIPLWLKGVSLSELSVMYSR